MLSLNYRDNRPLYEQIWDSLRRLIVAGALAPDEKLPSVRALATELAINPNTIQRAYAELENQGFIYSIPGKGSFAASRREPDPKRREELLHSFREAAAELHYMEVSAQELHTMIEEEYAV